MEPLSSDRRGHAAWPAAVLSACSPKAKNGQRNRKQKTNHAPHSVAPDLIPIYDGLDGTFPPGSGKEDSSSGGQARLRRAAGFMPCCGAPQAGQASDFNVISAPQHVQYAAKVNLPGNPNVWTHFAGERFVFAAARRTLYSKRRLRRISSLREVLRVCISGQPCSERLIAHLGSPRAIHGTAENHQVSFTASFWRKNRGG